MGEGGRRLRVFISASPGELTDERDAARAAVRTLRLTPVMRQLGGDEGAGADGRDDVFVGLYWQRYGWKSDESAASAVEDEYLGGGDVPRLVYVKEPAPEREPELGRLLEQIRSRDRVSSRTFATPGELAELLLDDLAELLSRRFYGGRTPLQDLPEGTVSLLFADLDGSTPIVRLLGAAYPSGVLDPFRAVVTDAVSANGGAIVDFEGDGASCAFAKAGGAAAAAVEIQRTLPARKLAGRARSPGANRDPHRSRAANGGRLRGDRGAPGRAHRRSRKRRPDPRLACDRGSSRRGRRALHDRSWVVRAQGPRPRRAALAAWRGRART